MRRSSAKTAAVNEVNMASPMAPYWRTTDAASALRLSPSALECRIRATFYKHRSGAAVPDDSRGAKKVMGVFLDCFFRLLRRKRGRASR
jgi:hypothetical protein